jgi:hypothetical protein
LRHLGAAILLAALLIGAPGASSTELSEILEISRVSPPARVAFREERHNPMFESPLLIEGFLEYLGPGVLGKVIESPFQEAFYIEAGEISMIRDGEVRQLPVKRSKALETMLSAFEALLSGDTERLETVFDYEVSGETSNWTIDLQPKSRRIREHLSSLRLSGNDAGVSKIFIDLSDGEWHVMNIQHEVATDD